MIIEQWQGLHDGFKARSIKCEEVQLCQDFIWLDVSPCR